MRAGADEKDISEVNEAIAYFQRALRIRPDDAQAHNNLGAILFQVGRVPEAILHLEQRLRLKPGDANAHYGLGTALLELGKVPA